MHMLDTLAFGKTSVFHSFLNVQFFQFIIPLYFTGHIIFDIFIYFFLLFFELRESIHMHVGEGQREEEERERDRKRILTRLHA